MAGSVKLKDIANELGTSIVTVSNALSGKKGVSEAVRAQVIEKAKELGYDNAKQNKSPRNKVTIGVIVSEQYIGIGTSFYWTMYQQTVWAASTFKALTTLEIISIDKEKELELPRLSEEGGIDGLIVIGKMEKKYLENIIKVLQIPAVLLDFRCEEIGCSSIMSNNYIGMYKMTRYLLKRGHRNIGYVGELETNENLCDRYFGYRKMMEEWGISVNPEWVIADAKVVSGKAAISLPKVLPTAFVCSSDFVAGFLYDKLSQMGYRVPEDISLVGYDNYLYGHPLAKKLTTYNVDMKEMAHAAVKMLLKKVDGSRDSNHIKYLDSYIVERSSVKSIQE